jgi:hypothetical protein
MDQAVIRALAKWPGVPSVYGWLALDERGNWLLRDASGGRFGPIGNAALRDFIGRNYARDARGCWYFQNGPQRVYVRLACAPFVYRFDGAGLVDQRGCPAGTVAGAWRDERGALILQTAAGAGNLDDRDLLAASERIVESETGAWFAWEADRVPLGRLSRAEMPARFGYVREPAPGESGGSE